MIVFSWKTFHLWNECQPMQACWKHLLALPVPSVVGPSPPTGCRTAGGMWGRCTWALDKPTAPTVESPSQGMRRASMLDFVVLHLQSSRNKWYLMCNIISIIELSFGIVWVNMSFWVCARLKPWEALNFGCVKTYPTGYTQPSTIGPGNGQQPHREAAEVCVLPLKTLNEAELPQDDAGPCWPPPPPRLLSHLQVDLASAPPPPGHPAPSSSRLAGKPSACWHCRGSPWAE